MSKPSPSRSGTQAADALSRIGQVYTVPTSNLENESSGGSGGAGSSGGSLWSRLFESITGGNDDASPDASGTYGSNTVVADGPTKLPPRRGDASKAKWRTETPIPARPNASGEGNPCPDGLTDLGTVVFVHDVDQPFIDFARHSDADRWMQVHTVDDMIQGLRDLVGTCGYVRGIMVIAHGASATEGGWRFGEDTDGNGHLDPDEAVSASDMVRGATDAKAFGKIIKGAFLPDDEDAFFAVAGCYTTGNSNVFIKAFHQETNLITMGSVENTTFGYSPWSSYWWSVEDSRVQINRDGTSKTDSTWFDYKIWRPF